MKTMQVFPEHCIGCRICEQWCIWQHAESGEENSRINVSRLHAEYENLPRVCHQCADTPCITACHFQALSREKLTGAILVDLERCTGCQACVRKCPYEAIRLNLKSKKVRICDLCGGVPQCVSHCPEGVLEFGEAGAEGERVTVLDKSVYEGLGKGLWSWQGGDKG